MSQSLTATEWAGARGDKWKRQLAGMEAMLKPIDAPLMSALRVDAPCSIVDVACGGGGTTLELLRVAPAGSSIHGFDVSPTLVDVARERAKAFPQASFEVADMATTLPPRTYDRMVSRFGTMFFDDPTSAFANLAGWLTPGGRFAFAVWAPMADNAFMTVVRDAVATVVDVPKVDPDGPGPYRYGDVSKLFGLLTTAGLSDLELREWRAPLALGGGLAPDHAAKFALAAFASFGELLAAAGPDALSQARETLTQRFTDHVVDGVVRLAARVHIVSGAR